jgi:hypothetical protein
MIYCLLTAIHSLIPSFFFSLFFKCFGAVGSIFIYLHSNLYFSGPSGVY